MIKRNIYELPQPHKMLIVDFEEGVSLQLTPKRVTFLRDSANRFFILHYTNLYAIKAEIMDESKAADFLASLMSCKDSRTTAPSAVVVSSGGNITDVFATEECNAIIYVIDHDENNIEDDEPFEVDIDGDFTDVEWCKFGTETNFELKGE